MFKLQLPSKDRTLKLKDINSEVQQIIDKNKEPQVAPEKQTEQDRRIHNLELVIVALYEEVFKPKQDNLPTIG
jgi:hypothetical protein